MPSPSSSTAYSASKLSHFFFFRHFEIEDNIMFVYPSRGSTLYTCNTFGEDPPEEKHKVQRQKL